MSKLSLLKPHLSEKSYALSEERNTYVFEVPVALNKHDVARAVTSQYEVSVAAVRIAAQPGKTKRSYRRKGRVVHRTRTLPIRKAYVRLKDGDKLPIFAAVEESKNADSTKVQAKGAK